MILMSFFPTQKTIKDISKYKHLEEELQEAETKYRKLIGFRKEEEKKE